MKAINVVTVTYIISPKFNILKNTKIFIAEN